jgi:putative membrane protein
MSLGLFLFVINAILLALVGYLTPSGFTVDGFLPALLGSIVLSLVSGLLSKFVKSER